MGSQTLAFAAEAACGCIRVVGSEMETSEGRRLRAQLKLSAGEFLSVGKGWSGGGHRLLTVTTRTSLSGVEAVDLRSGRSLCVKRKWPR